MSIIFPEIDPVIFSFGDSPFKITWYSLSYIGGILLSWLYIKYLNKLTSPDSLSVKIIDDLITSIIIGIVVGGRLGYVIFYDLNNSLNDPISIFKTWNGGMSFHGGLLGVIIATYIHAKTNKIEFFTLMDFVAAATPIGLFLGRIANFINAELYGRITNMPWGVVFPGNIEARHPSQLYESFLEGITLFIILFFSFSRARKYKGMISGLFLVLYSAFRGFIENYREPDAHLGFIWKNFTMGQILSTPMIIVGLVIIYFSIYKSNNENFR